MSDLARRKCAPCEGGVAPLTAEGIGSLHAMVPDWTVRDDRAALSRTFGFSRYGDAVAFVNAVAWIAQREDHHPDVELGYDRVVVRWSTHAIGGLSDNDFICAAKVDQLVSDG